MLASIMLVLENKVVLECFISWMKGLGLGLILFDETVEKLN